MQLKEQSLEQFYNDYLQQYSTARRKGATPTNMHPEDIPTIVFIVDTLIHLCSLPVRILLPSTVVSNIMLYYVVYSVLMNWLYVIALSG